MLCCGAMDNKYTKYNAFTSPENLYHNQYLESRNNKYLQNEYSNRVLGNIENIKDEDDDNDNYKKKNYFHYDDHSDLELHLTSFGSSCYEEDHFKQLIRQYLPHHYLGDIIGQGGFGKVYNVSSSKSGRKYAVKFLKNKDSFEQEYQILSVVMNIKSDYFCTMYRAHCSSDGAFFLMSLQGKNLKSLMNSLPKKRFSGSTGLRVAYQMLEAIEYFHTSGYVHRDIKLSNFVLSNENITKIKLIDFGVCRTYKRKGKIVLLSLSHKPKRYVGTLHYCSLPVHNLIPASPRDDIESWFYSCMQAFHGKIPWYRCKKEDHEIVKYMKKKMRSWNQATIDGYKYRTIYPLLEKIDEIGYYDEVDYRYYKTYLKQIMDVNNIEMEQRYDWQDQL